METLSSEALEKVQGKILCCECGTPIDTNPSNMCVACLRTQVDITECIPKQVTIHFCRNCERYLNPPQQWVSASLESRELMAVCLKKLKNLGRVKLIDASFIWTEPHSKRLKVKLQIQGEVIGGAILQQTFVVEYTVSNQMCDDCHRVEAKDSWKAMVQLRQKGTKQRKTLFYVEQLLIKYQATKNCVGIKPHHEGLDFYFGSESNGKKLTEFFQSVIPMRYTHSKKLISHDVNSNTYNYKYTFSVDVVPVCKDNVVCLPTKLAHSLGGIGQICVVNRVSQAVHIIDPNTCQFVDISATMFFKTPFQSLCRQRDLVEFTVMNIEPIRQKERNTFMGQGPLSQRHMLADCWVVRSTEVGMTEDTIHCRTFLGHILSIGDTVMGLDLKNSNVNNPDLENLPKSKIPDVVLVKKQYQEKALRNRRRKWKLKHIEGFPHMETQSVEDEFDAFRADIEEDPAMRQHIAIYKDNKVAVAVDEDDTDDGGCPQITLAEMLDDLEIGEDATGEAGAEMTE